MNILAPTAERLALLLIKRFTLTAVALLGGCWLVYTNPVHSADPVIQTQAAKRQIMQDLANSLSWMLRYVLEQDFESDDGTVSDEAVFAVDRLRAAAALAEDHIGASDVSRRKLGISLSESVAELEVALDDGYSALINYHVSDLVDRCVACHLRMPKADSAETVELFPIPEDLVRDRDFAVKFYVTTRQFDTALALIEEDILSKQAIDDLVEADLYGRFDEYLWIAIRSNRDPESATTFLRSLRSTMSSPFYLIQLVDHWLTDLEEIEPLFTRIDGSTDERDFAYQLIDRSRHRTQIPFSREALVNDIAAATLLRARLDSAESKDSAEVAEINYQLALLEAKLVGPDYAAPQMEFLLEAAIRAEPAGPRATAALSLLQEFGLHIAQTYEVPEERFRRSMIRIEELKTLIDAHRE